MKSFIIWSVIVGVVFAFAWRFGWLARLTKYVQETREELRKCAWPNMEELWGSTVLVMVAIALLGAYTVVVDFIISFGVSSIV